MSRPGGRVPSRGPWLVAFLFAIALALFLLVEPGGPGSVPTLDGGAVVAEKDDGNAVLRGAARAVDAAPPPAPAVDAVPVEPAEPEEAVWRVHGRVRSPAGDPISGASLRLTLYRGALDIPLAAQETLADAAGHYAFLVPLSWPPR